MAHTKGKSEGGSGGKHGHSGMEHACKTEEVKDSARVVRRVEDKRLAVDELTESADPQLRLSQVRNRGGAGSRRIEVAPTVETELRAREVQLLLNVIEPDPDLEAFLVTDEASALDVSSHSPEVIRARLETYLRRPLPVSLRTPLWILVDAIRRELPGWPDVGPLPN
jgi:hypothetical protein